LVPRDLGQDPADAPHKPLRLLPPPEGDIADRAARPAVATPDVPTVALVALSLFAPFAATLQGALLYNAVAVAIIGWSYSTNAWAAVVQRQWNARLTLPLAAIAIILCFSAMLALDATTARGARPEAVPALPARLAGPSLPDSASVRADGDQAPTLFAPSASGAATDAEVSAKAVALANQLLDEQLKLDEKGQAPAAGDAYEAALKPAEAQLQKELEQRLGVTASNDPNSCRMAEAQRSSGALPLSQRAFCLLDLAKALDRLAR